MAIQQITAALAPTPTLAADAQLARLLIGAKLTPTTTLAANVYALSLQARLAPTTTLAAYAYQLTSAGTTPYGPGQLGNDVLDGGLSVIDTAATAIHVLSATPKVFTDIAAFTLGNKTFTAGSAFASPVDDGLGGRTIASTAFTDGTLTRAGNATDWAVVDGTRLLANGKLLDPMALPASGPLAMPSFTIAMPSGLVPPPPTLSLLPAGVVGAWFMDTYG